jgi:predicted transposase YdaD
MEGKSDPAPFDTAMKLLSGGNPQAWVSFLLHDAVYKNDLNRELRTRKIEADTLYDVVWDHEPIILHIEFQRRRDDNMPKRVWEYNALTRMATGKPVYSVVIYPIEIPSITDSVYTMSLRKGSIVLDSFSFQQIKLWEIEPDVFEQPYLTGLLPLLPLTKNGQNRETVERMLRDMELAGVSKEAYAMSEIVCGLVLTSEQDKEWLKVRFQNMSDILEESWVYQDILQKGKQQGLLHFVERRFPSLLVLAKSVIEGGLSLQQFQTLEDKLYSAITLEDARKALQDA